MSLVFARGRSRMKTGNQTTNEHEFTRIRKIRDHLQKFVSISVDPWLTPRECSLYPCYPCNPWSSGSLKKLVSISVHSWLVIPVFPRKVFGKRDHPEQRVPDRIEPQEGPRMGVDKNA